MSYLNDNDIRRRVEEEGMIRNYEPANLNPCSYDLRLGDETAVYDWGWRDRGKGPDGKPLIENGVAEVGGKPRIVKEKGDVFYIYPQTFVLATTVERVEIPDDLAAQVVGKSSIGRMGLFVQNAGHIDPGFKGEITLELYNASDATIKVTPGQRIAQLVFIPLTGKSEKPYEGRYQNQEGATPVRPEVS